MIKNSCVWGLVVVAIIIFCGCDGFNRTKVKPVPGFVMDNDLACTILYSTDRSDIGKKISLLDLKTDQTRALFEHKEYAGTSPLKKIFEDDDIVVLQLVAYLSGAVDTISVNKKSGIFLRSAMSGMLGDVSASKGNCK